MSSKRTRSKRQEPVTGTRAAEAAAAPPPADQDVGGVRAGRAGAPQTEARRATKASLLQRMLSGPEGATLATLAQATGWQAHTARAALTRLRQAGHAVERSRSEAGETVYRIHPAEGAAADLARAADEAAQVQTASADQKTSTSDEGAR